MLQTALKRIAAELDLPEATLAAHVDEVFTVSPAAQRELLTHVQRIADIVSHIIQERSTLYTKLHNIAELTKI